MSRPGLAPVTLLLALVTAFIVYGSLYPFSLKFPPPGTDVSAVLTRAWSRPPGGRGDLVTNLFLYMPFGLLAATALRRRALPARLGLVIFAGATLSAGLEVAQIFDFGRTPSIWDVLCNTFGTAAGAVLAAFGAAQALDRRPRVAEPLAALLVLAWLGYRLYPYVPALDLQAWRDNLKPLVLYPVLEPVRTCRLAVSWTAAALLTEAAFGAAVARILVPFGLAIGLAAEVVLSGNRLDLAEAMALGLALLAWPALRSRSWTPVVMAAALCGAVLAERLEPFVFTEVTRDFGWLPFRSLMNGSREAGAQAMLAKLFLQGALLWWLLRAGMRLPLAAGLQAALVLGVSLLQTRIPGRSAEITDTLLVLGLTMVFHLVQPVLVPPRLDASWRNRAAAAKRRNHGAKLTRVEN